MKKILSLLILSAFISQLSFAQFFQGSFSNTNNVLVFKMKPTATFATQISYLETSFRYNISTTPAFTIGAITTNTTNFPSMDIKRLPDYTDGTYNYIRFVHNTGVIASKTYTVGTEYEIFTLTLGGSPSLGSFDMASDLVSGNYQFGVVDGAANFFDPGASDQLYGSGFFKAGDGQFVPLVNVPLPVKFLGFTVTKNNNAAILNWSVESEDANTDKYEILRSSNGVDFATVATVAAKNNGMSANTYSFTQDNLSTIRNTGVIYYRIKQIDKDGKSVITEIKNVRLTSKGLTIGVYPNPIKHSTNVSFDLLKDSEVILTVNDASGKQLMVNQFNGFKGSNIRSLDLSKFATGNYILKLQTSTDVNTLPIVKANN